MEYLKDMRDESIPKDGIDQRIFSSLLAEYTSTGAGDSEKNNVPSYSQINIQQSENFRILQHQNDTISINMDGSN